MNKTVVQAIVVCLLLVVSHLDSDAAELVTNENVVLITIDGLRWQDLITGADARREQLMPFFWNFIAKNGQVLGGDFTTTDNRIAQVINGTVGGRKQ